MKKNRKIPLNQVAPKARSQHGTGIGKKQGAALISEKLSLYCGWILVALPLLVLAGSAATDIAIILMGLCFLLYSANTHDWRWTQKPWVRLAGAIYLYIVARSLLSEVPLESVGRSAPWIRFPLFAAAIAYWLCGQPHVKRCLPWSLVTAVTVLVADMAFQYVTGFDVIGRSAIVSDGGALRLTGPYVAPRAGITVAWLAWPAIAFLFAVARTKRQWLAAGLLWGACVVIVFLSGERMATLLMILGSLLLVLLVKETRRVLLWLVPAGVLTLGVLVMLNPALIVRQVNTTVQAAEEATASPYGRLWVSSVKIIQDYPVFGVGAKQFRRVCLKEPYGGSKEILNCNLHPHHLYLEWWVEQGLVGLLLFIALIVLWVREGWRYWLGHKEDALFAGLAIACIVKLFALSTAVSFFVNWSVIPFWLALGWMLSKTREV